MHFPNEWDIKQSERVRVFYRMEYINFYVHKKTTLFNVFSAAKITLFK